eukprot:3723395-Rhodomonas_salina.1
MGQRIGGAIEDRSRPGAMEDGEFSRIFAFLSDVCDTREGAEGEQGGLGERGASGKVMRTKSLVGMSREAFT